MIYELHTDTVQPAKLKAFLTLTGKVGFKLRSRYSTLLGCWTTETGLLNQVVYLRGYESYHHRAAVRAALALDHAWNARYMDRARPMLQFQETLVMLPVDFWPFTPPTGRGIYELRNYRIHPGVDRIPAWLEQFRHWLVARKKYSLPVGVWRSELGELGRVIHLWHYESLEHRERVRVAALQDPARRETVATVADLMQGMETRILVPTDFSPMR